MSYELLEGVRIVEWSDLVAGPYCAKILADLGADVTKVETRQGDPARSVGPYVKGALNDEGSALFLWLNGNKSGITLDVEKPTGKELFERLLSQSEVLIHDKQPGALRSLGLTYEHLHELNPRLVVAAVTPFGQSGPYCDYKAYPLNVFHSGGEGYMTPGGTTYKDRPPVQAGSYVGEIQAAISAAAACMVGIFVARTKGIGQSVDVSKQEALAFLNFTDLMKWPNFGELITRFTRGWRDAGPLKCKDGYIEYSPIRPDDWEALVEILGKPAWAGSKEFETKQDREKAGRVLLDKIETLLADHTREEIFEKANAKHCPLAPYYSPAEVANSEQYQVRGFFKEIEHRQAGRVTCPSEPFHVDAPSRGDRPAPLLGEHNEEIYCRRLGLTDAEVTKLRSARII